MELVTFAGEFIIATQAVLFSSIKLLLFLSLETLTFFEKFGEWSEMWEMSSHKTDYRILAGHRYRLHEVS